MELLGVDLQPLLWWATGLSVLAVLATLVGVPWVVARLPGDYFNREHRTAWREYSSEPWYALILGLLKNVLGAALVLFGIVLFFTPGQGLLTVVAGLLLMNFPGKYAFERWLVQRPGVMKGLNWLRRRHGEGPFQPPLH